MWVRVEVLHVQMDPCQSVKPVVVVVFVQRTINSAKEELILHDSDLRIKDIVKWVVVTKLLQKDRGSM